MSPHGRRRPKRTEGTPVRRTTPVRSARELARRYELLLSVAGCVGWEWEVESGGVAVEGDVSRLLGLSPDATIRFIHDFVELVHPEDRLLHQASLKQALVKGRGPYTSAFRIVRPDDGRIVFLEDRGMVDWERDYSTLRVTGFLFEISGRS